MENNTGVSQDADIEATNTDVTEFTELLGTFNLNNFQITNDDLKITSPGFTVTGFGEIDIATQTVDYNLRVNIGEGVQGELGQRLSKIKGNTIPIRCRGGFETAVCRPDMKALYSIYARNRLDEKKSQLLEEKYGIEGGDGLSSKDVLKQVLVKELIDKKKPKNGNYERPIGERNSQNDPSQTTSEPAEQTPKEAKEELKEDLLERALEELFK